MTAPKQTLALDCEVYSNYFLAQFKSIETGKVRAFEIFDGCEFDKDTVRQILKSYRIVTFNGINFDMPLLTMALCGQSTNQIKAVCDAIIQRQLKHWQTEREFGFTTVACDHIDLIETTPGVAISLKLYGARLHSKKLQDLPIDPAASISPDQRRLLREYCVNDLDTTIDLWKVVTNPKDDIIKTREMLSAEFDIDLRSKSDAQIAEAMIKSRVASLKGSPVSRSNVPTGTAYKYHAPKFIKFQHLALRAMLQEVLNADFVVDDKGQIRLPDSLATRIELGQSKYQMGIGGLHSCEKSKAHVADANTLLRDRDVVSYYPSLILQCGLFPPNMGIHFQGVYKDFFDRRIAAKKSGDKSKAQTLKIVLNGTFGKLGSMYSVIYAPNLLIQVTVTGQLALLMLIERMEAAAIPVVSANTDGIVMACPKYLEPTMLQIVKQWEAETGLETEETRYRALYSRDVNNYVALKDDGSYKTKGVLATPGIMKNPENQIVGEAVCAFLNDGVPVAQTIISCADVRKFLRAKRVTGGGQWGSQYLGKVVRWYRSTRSTTPITYVKNGNKVGGSDGAMPLMTLPDSLPVDIDYNYYLQEATDLLKEIGAI